VVKKMGELQLILRQTSLKAIRRLPMVLWSVWIVLLVELMSRGRWGDALGWTIHAIPELMLNALVVLSFLLLFTAITASVRLSFWLVATLFFAFGLISGVKQAILGVPFLPWDLMLTSETQDMAKYIGGIMNFTVISGVIAFIGISILLLYKLPAIKLVVRWKQRVIMAAASLFLFASIYSDDIVPLKTLAHVQNIAWDQSENVKANGFLLTTMMNLKFLFMKEPEGYSRDAVRSIAASVPPAVPQAGEKKPNIIVILSESFWDATQVKNLTFSRDPLPFYHSLVDKYAHGTMLSPQFGGGTANVEFEVLTGNSMTFMPQGSVPYNQYVDKGMESLASILGRQGYASTAINPFHSWFYNSKKVYENLGFERYISQEFFEQDYIGPYLSDRSVAKYIMESSGSTQGPDFIFANTMQNHYHYYPGKFEQNSIEVTGVEGESKGLLETYAEGLTGADEMLRMLVEHYEKLDEPTLILFFGDHLPSLGEDYKAYRDSGYLEENDPDFLNKMYRVPTLIWDNYLPEERREKIDMNTFFIGSHLLKLAERPGNYYTDFLHQLSTQSPIIPPYTSYEDAGVSIDAMKQYEKLQYDMIFGKQYALEEWKNTIVKPNYVLGFGKLQVKEVTVEPADKGKVMRVSGDNLPQGAILQVNGQPVETAWKGKQELTATLPAELASRTPLKVEVVVKDSKNNLVGKSNEYSYTGATPVQGSTNF
jgi:phosphoglycerol transferase MdoB-like AlkP superfamily enzyme